MKLQQLLATVAICITGTSLFAADYPTRPIRYVTSSSPGQPQDAVARLFAEKLSKRLGQAVVVENKPGAFGLIAFNNAMAAPADGYTIYASSSQLVSQPALIKGFNHDLAKDVTAITKIVEFRTASVVKASSSVNSIDDLVARMQANPGKINMGISSAIDTLMIKAFQNATGTRFEQIRFSSATQGTTSLIAGEIDAMLVLGITFTQSHVDSGALRFVSVNGNTRDPLIPQVKSLGESSTPQLRELAKSALFKPFWLGLMVPSKVPPDVVKALYEASRDVMKDPELIKRFQSFGMDVVVNPPTPERATKELIEDMAEITKAAKEAGIEPQ